MIQETHRIIKAIVKVFSYYLDQQNELTKLTVSSSFVFGLHRLQIACKQFELTIFSNRVMLNCYAYTFESLCQDPLRFDLIEDTPASSRRPR